MIIQEGKPIALYSRKWMEPQTWYTVTEKKFLSMVETLKEFQEKLLGQQLKIYTDYKNLTCKNFNTDQVLRWKLIVKEYGLYIKYILGEKNIAADALSWLSNSINQQTTHESAYTMEAM